KQSDARALVLASANPFLFSAGADVKELATLDAVGDGQILSDAHALFDELERGEIATVAAVNGLAFGGGCELAMACDVRVCARSALFGQPEIKLGIMPAWGGTQRLPRVIGLHAIEMICGGEPITAAKAAALGLVFDAVPA
ncbi:MAG: enoyl-CoA hydratase/isomerase family protein, partial [Planctomycetaceae bacterium]|nr:enoyl-CoA hydratase/isomerase family protein [Planctomycetaceae bacterium]